MKFQYNKMAIQQIEKDLLIRTNALPTLKAKEKSLGLEIKKLADEKHALEEDFKSLLNVNREFSGLWMEYPDLLSIEKTEISFRNIAGTKIPFLKNIDYRVREFSLFANRAWTPGGTEILKDLCTLSIQIHLSKRGLEILHHARKKTTQKVNLYEKVQIPEYIDSIRKIKRFLEDEENLAKASQKIVKERHSRLEEND